MKTAPEVLREAAARVEQGWTQGAYVDGAEVCAVGAVCYALYGRAGYLYSQTSQDAKLDPFFLTVLKALSAAMEEQYPAAYHAFRASPVGAPSGPMDEVILFNDEVVPDKAELIACMEKAASKLEEVV